MATRVARVEKFAKFAEEVARGGGEGGGEGGRARRAAYICRRGPRRRPGLRRGGRWTSEASGAAPAWVGDTLAVREAQGHLQAAGTGTRQGGPANLLRVLYAL